MGDLTKQTQPTQIGDDTYEVELSRDWKIWGPNGGYVSAAVLRAVGCHTDKTRPVSYYGQYLQVPAFGEAEVVVECVKPGKRISA